MNKQHILLNAVLFQFAWFSAALVSWLLSSLFVIAGLIQLSVVYRSGVAKQALLVTGAILLGIAMDSSFHHLGIYTFLNNPAHVLGFPFWLLCMWFAFATSLCLSLAWLFAKPVIFIVAAAIMGPVSYLAGRELDLLMFVNSDIPWMIAAWGSWAALTQGFAHLIGQSSESDSIQDSV
ncbi:DUF2878 domain-containing protein [Bermanella marisrubri]|uniref:DUF2878 domain-containing protein n=1 Tax=Bermanella marisrubri TaxID=207949 RepID=Q1MZC8_9GAMM|nr:DUF2878 domain-containing protein [Bermanella marisrubri]EAT11338.1 hypothetical protein RED65_12962 [Oceanobacter sp. RED65] [Bermanella marisrubri]QIZ85275.1 DUF2878 domain-containing protein [Bermanella marisrubri]